MRQDAKLHPPDYWLLGTTLALVVVGLWLVFDASYAKAADLRSMNHDPYYLLKRQSVFAAFGLICMLVVSRLSFERLRQWTIVVLGAALGALVAVLFIGHSAHGTRAWFRIGPITIQPSEFAKIALLVYLALALSSWRTFARGGPKRWLVPAVVSAAMVILVVLERDLGMSALLCIASASAFYAAGARKRWLVLFAICGVLAAALAMVCVPHCRERWRAFVDPWAHRFDEGYQTVHSLVGIGTAGWTGVGLCEGRVKFYMPACSTDYIFATLVEEAGLIGGLALLVGFGIFAYRGLHIAHRSKSVYGAVLAASIVSMIGAQVVINIAVVTAAIPATGLPLPFISYGGSGMVSTLICVGLLLSVSRQADVVVERRDLDESSVGRRRDRRSYLSCAKRRTRVEGSRPAGRAAVHR